MSRFINLHQHTHHSILDGCASIPALVQRAKEIGMPSLSITDHGTLSGALEFYLECKRNGIKPIIGCEMYIDDAPDRKGEYRHIVLLAKNLIGYKNLLKIVSEAHINGFYYRPRTTTQRIFEHGEGLIVLSACMRGIIAYNYGRNNSGALDIVRQWKERFGDDFYIELNINELKQQKLVNGWLLGLAEKAGVEPIVTLDSHYVNPEDVHIQDFILLVRERKTIDDMAKVVYQARHLFLMDGKQLWKFAQEWGYVITQETFNRMILNTKKVADKCNLEIETGSFHIPIAEEDTDAFKKRVIKTARKLFDKLGFNGEQKLDYFVRLENELRVIIKLGFHNYFVIVEDLVNWCRSHDIFVGPARGSVAGSLVSYVLGITKIDPIRFGLLFERFLNENRKDMPDIDLDFDANKREKVFDYIRNKYGRNKVSRVVTFGTFGSVGALRDIGRVFKLPLKPINEIANEIYRVGSIEDAYKTLSGTLKSFWVEHKRFIKLAKDIAPLIRNIGVHPCGTVIAPKPVYTYCPLQRVKGEIVSAYSEGIRGRELSEIGLVKFDILGLNTCSIISDTIDFVKKTTGKDIENEMWDIDITDDKLLHEARAGNTIGSFQFETDSATALLRKIKPRTFAEIAALNAINRPGPLGSGAIDKFYYHEGIGINNKGIKRILKETRGVLVYQEQVMQILNKIAGYSLVEADEIRKLAAKKLFSDKTRADFEDDFLERCTNKIGRRDAKRLLNIIKEFTRYSFNKSHAVSYTYLFFQVLYLKNYYPVEFFASLLSNTSTGLKKDPKHGSEKNKIFMYINEARNYGIEILGPDINTSGIGFSAEKGGIRFGLGKVKTIKDATAEEIIARRPYTSLQDFIDKSHGSKIHKGKIISLIRAGAFDSLGGRSGIKRQFNALRKEQIFDLRKDTVVQDSIDAFGFILLHPFTVEKVKRYLVGKEVISSASFRRFNRWSSFKIAGIVLSAQKPWQGKSALVVKVQDHRGDIFLYLDNDAVRRFGAILKPYNIVSVLGKYMGGNKVLCQRDCRIFNLTPTINEMLEAVQWKTKNALV